MEAQSSAKPSYAIHTSYDINHPPARLSSTSVRFICISDNHGSTLPVPDGDVLLHAGDLTDLGQLAELERVMDWICSLPHSVKVIIGGNHDLPLDTRTYEENWKNLLMGPPEDPVTFKYLLTGKRAKEAGVLYLEHSTGSFDVNGKTWTIWGSPSSMGRPGSAFVYPRSNASAAKYDEIQEETDIILTHSPPDGILDEIEWQNKHVHVGCPFLAETIEKIKPRLHVFGHLHQSRGAIAKTWDDPVPDSEKSTITVFANASLQASGRGINDIQEKLGARQCPELRDNQHWFQPIILDLEP